MSAAEETSPRAELSLPEAMEHEIADEALGTGAPDPGSADPGPHGLDAPVVQAPFAEAAPVQAAASEGAFEGAFMGGATGEAPFAEPSFAEPVFIGAANGAAHPEPFGAPSAPPCADPARGLPAPATQNAAPLSFAAPASGMSDQGAADQGVPDQGVPNQGPADGGPAESFSPPPLLGDPFVPPAGGAGADEPSTYAGPAPGFVPEERSTSGWPEAAPLALLGDFQPESDPVPESPAPVLMVEPVQQEVFRPQPVPDASAPQEAPPAATFQAAPVQDVYRRAPDAPEPAAAPAAPWVEPVLAPIAAAMGALLQSQAPAQPQGPSESPPQAAPAAPAQPEPKAALRAEAGAPPPRAEKADAAKAQKAGGKGDGGTEGFAGVDIETFSRNIARLVEEGGKAMAAYLGPREKGKTDDLADDLADAMKTVGHVVEYWMADPQRTIEAQSRLMGGYLSIWANTMKRLAGEEVSPVAAPDPKDARFKDDSWNASPIFDALKQAYLVTSHWAEDMVEEAEGLDPHVKHKAEFLVRQIANAISPSNFVLTNPEIIRETLTSSGENLVKGMQNLTEDLVAGQGTLKIRQTDLSAFEVGRNLATTPGKVIFENELMQLIQYEATTDQVMRTPVLIVPPWINKFYILDLTAEKSLIKWLVDQGVSVFTVSWVNPDARLAAKGFDDYMQDGIMAALDAVAMASGERRAHAVGYCVGGTLLATTLAYMAATGDDRIASATFLTTQIDFTHAGDLKVFVDEEQLAILERKMKEMGYLEGSKMASAFNMLRSNDLIWPYVVNNYMKGKAPFPFDLLFWNSDSTRMPAANHSYYLRNCYLTNNIARGRAELAGLAIDMTKVNIPVYSLATREDHIAPANSVYIGANMLSGPVRYVLAGSGHIAGVVNPPAKMKYQYWTDGPAGPSFDAWLKGAEEHKGSWWPDWLAWFSSLHPEQVPARAVGGGRLAPIEDAPGRYVKERS